MNMCQVKHLRIQACRFNENSSINFLDSFPNLKHLVLVQNYFFSCKNQIIPNYNELLIRKYSALKRLEFRTILHVPLPIATTLESNPNIQVLEMTATNFIINMPSIRNAKLSLDELSIDLNFGNVYDLARYVKFFQSLNELQSIGIYKRLRINCSLFDLSQDYINELAQLKSMIKLCVNYEYKQPVALSSLNDLREIIFRDSSHIADLDLLASNLEDLELIYFRTAKLTHLMPFFSRAKKMKTIRINILQDGGHFDQSTQIIALSALNKERKQLRNAEKITLYVSDGVYHATNVVCQTNLELINLRYISSYCWHKKFNESENFYTYI